MLLFFISVPAMGDLYYLETGLNGVALGLVRDFTTLGFLLYSRILSTKPRQTYIASILLRTLPW